MKRFNYSEAKFNGFDPSRQVRILYDIIAELDTQIGDPVRTAQLKTSLQHYRSLVKADIPEDLALLCYEISCADSPHELLDTLKPFFDNRAALKKDDQIIVSKGDRSKVVDQAALTRSRSVTLVLDNLRSVFNVGVIFRTAECLGLGELILCGITPTPVHPNMNKTAMNTCDLVKWSYHPSTAEALKSLRKNRYRIYALETASRASSVFDISFDLPLALIVGNEALGIDPRTLSIADEVISLPVNGWKNSLNVGIALAVTAYQIIYGNKNN